MQEFEKIGDLTASQQLVIYFFLNQDNLKFYISRRKLKELNGERPDQAEHIGGTLQLLDRVSLIRW